jgi:hypothetical protein
VMGVIVFLARDVLLGPATGQVFAVGGKQGVEERSRNVLEVVLGEQLAIQVDPDDVVGLVQVDPVASDVLVRGRERGASRRNEAGERQAKGLKESGTGKHVSFK